MTYMKCTCNKVKIATAAFWLSTMFLLAFFSPMILIPVSFLALFHIAYLMLDPVPLPIVLSFVSMVSLSFYAVYMKTAPLS
ncbi:MAG TPA: hypothetical protein EYO73_12700 [Sulfurimonas sp.]|nr:hypothetical protein [Sulfurimonas sp.]